MSDPRSPVITIYVEPVESAMLGKNGDVPGPRLAKGVAIDGTSYHVPADSPIAINTGANNSIEVTVAFLAHDVRFVTE